MKNIATDIIKLLIIERAAKAVDFIDQVAEIRDMSFDDTIDAIDEWKNMHPKFTVENISESRVLDATMYTASQALDDIDNIARTCDLSRDEVIHDGMKFIEDNSKECETEVVVTKVDKKEDVIRILKKILGVDDEE